MLSGSSTRRLRGRTAGVGPLKRRDESLPASSPDGVPGPAADSAAELFVLVLTAEEAVAALCLRVVRSLHWKARAVAVPADLLAELEKGTADVAVVDLASAAEEGLAWVAQLRQRFPAVGVIVVGDASGRVAEAVAIAHGAAEFLPRPFQEADLAVRLERLGRSLWLDRENRVLREQVRTRPGVGGLVGVSPRMQQVYRLIEKLSRRDCSVLILGESGTGKELVARAIHSRSPRARGPFVAVDCAGLVPTLFESELFGHVRGAFTGALGAHKGLMEAAQGGTLFLDEIGELPLELQAKLLRVLQEKQVRPVGSTTTVPVDVRVIAATNRDLEREVQQGRFRQDLFYRLNVVSVRLPALRERKSDIPLLVQHFIEKYAPPDRPTPVLAEEALARLLAYDWPGNVRELENAIARALALNSGPVLHLADLPSHVQPSTAALATDVAVMPLKELEKRAILKALEQTGGDKATAARLLGIGKTTLYRKLKQYGCA